MATIRRKKSESFAILSSPGPWPQVLINWLATLAVIIVFGLIMLFSASYTTGYLRMGDSFYYIKSQVFCLGLGLAVMLLFSRIDHRFLRRMVWPGYVVCIVMLIAVLFSAPLNGCRRWLRIGFTIQVSEIAKFEMILLTAHLAAKAPHLEKLDPASGRCDNANLFPVSEPPGGASRQASGSISASCGNSSSRCCPLSRWSSCSCLSRICPASS